MTMAHDDERRQCDETFDGFAPRRWLAPYRGEPDHQRRDRDDAKCIRCEPVLPGAQERCLRFIKEGKPKSPANSRKGRCNDRCAYKAQHVAKPVETERRTEVVIDQPRCQQGFSRIAQGKDEGAREISIAQKIGHDGCHHRANGNCPSRAPPECDQRARGNAGGRPEHGDTVGSEQRKAELRRQDVNTADNDSQPAQAQPSPRPISRVGALCLKILQHGAVFGGPPYLAQQACREST